MPFLELLQMRPGEAAPGHGRLEITVGPRHLRNLGIMHGGVLGALLDSAMGMAAGSLAPEGQFVVTVQLNLNFIRPAWEGETLLATGEICHKGKQTAVARGEVRTTTGALVGNGSATFLYLLHTDPARARFGRDDRHAAREARGDSSAAPGPHS
jgi:uncharacterized protein (TIGR00369 family)